MSIGTLPSIQEGLTGISLDRAAERPKHLLELDSLRGVAALVVVLNHFQQIWMGAHPPAWASHPKRNPVMWLLVNGHASVILFFLLSGFVLALSNLRGSSLSYLRYAIRRICRIYMPYLAGLCFAVLCCGLFWGRHGYSSEAALWASRPDFRSIEQHLIMLGRFNVFRYNVAFWSLVHEMRISLVFPIIWYLATLLRMRYALAVAAGCTTLSTFGSVYVEGGLAGNVRMTGFSYTISFCGIFLLGAVLARKWQVYTARLGQQKTWVKGLLATAALVLYLYPPPAFGRFDVSDFFVACGAMVILLFSLVRFSAFSRFLRTVPVQFLGRISYSLYLTHLPVLLVLAYTRLWHVPFALLLVPYLAFSLGLAAIAYRAVELPAMALGRLLAPATSHGRSHAAFTAQADGL